ncbi:AbgT family transporter [uncultured Ilyobacter sp.]|uniref:AbgT family transporter n=1 Tax=uncultured Ilyobacter sp. TaxID=544433 RepID=UPI0029C747F7|nr:AbgT family transporter [uncultured Ilyobacter sp.]
MEKVEMGKIEMQKEKKNFFGKFLSAIEKAGNKLPDPVVLFMILGGIVIVLSAIISSTGVSVVHPSTQETITVVNLMSKEGFRKILSEVVRNFQGFPALGLVLVVMFGAGVAEKSGLMEMAMRNSVAKVPSKLVTAVILLAGILANAAGDAGNIVLPPLAAVIFLAVGRHPLAGIFAAYAGVTGGFAANFMINMSDIIAASFTIPAAQVINPIYNNTPAMNYYFIIASTLLILAAGVFVTEKIVEPRLGKYEGEHQETASTTLSDVQKKGLKLAGISALVLIAIVLGLSLGNDPFMADAESGSVLAFKSPLMQGIVPLITLLFFVPGVVYGKVTGVIKNHRDVVSMMSKSVGEMGGYILLAFMASQFLAFFNWSNMGILTSVKGAEFLRNAGITGGGLIIGFILITCLLNLLIGSASAKWAIMAPIFIPMFMLLGYDPALTQMAFRIGDSITNTITPLSPYFPIVIAFAKKYDKDAGMGTIMANMTPYTIVFGIVWTILLLVFMFLNLPLGPGGGIFYIQ